MAVKTNKSKSCSNQPEKIVKSLPQSSIATPLAPTLSDEFENSSKSSETQTTDTSQNQASSVLAEKNTAKRKESQFQSDLTSNSSKNSNPDKFNSLRSRVSAFFDEKNTTKEKEKHSQSN